MSDEFGRYRAPALDKGLDVLELLADHEAGLSQAEIAKALGRSAGELYRMIDTLARRGYVRRVGPEERLALGTKMFALATRHPPMRRLLAAAGEATADIAQATLQSCHLSLYRDGNCFVAAQTDSPGRLGISVRLGAEVDLLDTSSGRVMLAFQDGPRRARMLKEHGATDLTAPLLDELDALREAGSLCAPSRQTHGITDLAVPILGRLGHAVAILSIPFIGRIDPPDSPDAVRCLTLLEAAANNLSATFSEELVEQHTAPHAA